MLKPKKILIVEDNEDDSFILVHRLRKIGQCDIRDAADGEQAVVLVAVFFRQDLVFPRSIFVVLAALDADCDDYIAKPPMNLCVVLREKLERWLPAAEEAR